MAPAAGQVPDAATPATPPATPPAPAAGDTAAQPPAEGAPATSNSGWIIELRGYHLHNNLDGKFKVGAEGEGEEFLKSTIIKNLELGKVKLPDGPKGETIEVSMADLGIKMPVVVTHEKTHAVEYYAESAVNANGAPPGQRPGIPEGIGMVPGGVGGAPQAANQPKSFKLRKYRFVIQFCWQQQPRGQRIEKMAQKKAAEASTATAGAEAPRPSS
jgi:hypothetical protein